MEVYVSAKELLAAAKVAYNKEEKDKTWLCGVMVKCDKYGNYTIAATDSYKAVKFHSEFVNVRALAGECCIPSKVIKDHVKSSDSFVHIACEDGVDYPKTKIEIYKGVGVKLEMRTSVECKYVNTAIFDSLDEVIEKWGYDIKQDVTCMYLNASYLSNVCDAITFAYGKNAPIDIAFADSHKPVMIKAKRNACDWCEAIIMPLNRN